MAFLINQSTHITNNLRREAVEVHHAFKLPQPHPSILPLIQIAGFEDVVSIGSFKIIPSLVTATCTSSTMGGCTLLLQSWVWYRMSFIAPSCASPYDWPLAKRWVGTPLNHTKCPRSVVNYRAEIDHMGAEHFDWVPYNTFSLPPRAYRNSRIWTTNTAMVCFHMVEWHLADRVKLQFALVQDPPSDRINLSQFHLITMQGQTDVNWERRHKPSINLWNDRENRCVVDNQHLTDPRGLLNIGVVDEEDQEDLPPPPTTQTDRRERNRNRHRRAAPSQETPQYEPHQPEQYEPHRHSVSHPPTFQQYEPHQAEQYESHRHSISNPPTFQQYEPHRHSISHPPTFQQYEPHQAEQYESPTHQHLKNTTHQ